MQATSKERILKKVRKALINQSPEIYPGLDFKNNIYTLPDQDGPTLDIVFAEQFTKADGKFIFCESLDEFSSNIDFLIRENNWKEVCCFEESITQYLKDSNIPFSSDKSDLEKMEVGITHCEFLIARTGSVMVSSAQLAGRQMAVFPPVHIVVAYTEQLVTHVKDAIENIQTKYGNKLPSLITTITGPSRTADIEKTLIIGAHGPKEIYVFMVDKNSGNSKAQGQK